MDILRRAQDADVEQCVDLVVGRLRWLAEQGTDQWTTRPQPPVVRNAYAAGHLWVLEDGKEMTGTVSLTTDAPAGWTEEELKTPALYVYKLAVIRNGERIGERLLAASALVAEALGIDILRWDAWTTNQRLHDYYKRLDGVEFLRIANTGWPSAAMFQADASKLLPDAMGLDVKLNLDTNES